MKLMRDLVGETLSDRYHLVARVAGGGMGEVYRGHDLLLDRTVAVKVLQPSLASDPELVARFRAEARAAARLTHPNIVSVHDWGAADDRTYYMVMEYVPGTDLRDLLVSRGSLEPAQAVEIIASVCDALAAAHRSGLVHRDVKPENVLIDRSGTVKVADFGIAVVADADLTMPAGVIPGTMRYLSPEQARGDQASFASDMWATGAVLGELLTGRPPLQGSGTDLIRRRALETVDPPSRHDPRIPADLDAIVMKACALNPSDRFANLTDMSAALRRVGVRSLHAAPPVASLLSDMTSEINLEELELTHLNRRRDERPRRSATRTVATLVVLIALAIGAVKVVASVAGTHDTTVPKLKGLSLAAASRRADANGVDIKVTEKIHDLARPKGTVLWQDPASGVVAKGSALDVVISAGPPRVEVPNLAGYSQAAAQVALRGAYLKPGAVTQKFALSPVGTVILTKPPSGKVEWGSKVALVVSRGPQPIGVPNVTGMSKAKATSQLKTAGFKVSVGTDYSNDVPRGKVISSTPASGVQAPEGSVVAIVISEGPRYKELTMPDVRSMSVDAATAKLQALGLRVHVVQSTKGCSTVVDSDPLAGTKIHEHDRVALFTC